MDLQSLIIGVIVIAICFLPFIYLGKKGKKREQQFFQLLLDKAKQLKCNITQHEVSGNLIIGLDNDNKELFFVKKTKTYERFQHINLNEMKGFTFNIESRMIVTKDSKQKIIDKLQLVFCPTDLNKKDVTFEFYNSDETLVLNGELQLIERWDKILRDNFNLKSINKKTA